MKKAQKIVVTEKVKYKNSKGQEINKSIQIGTLFTNEQGQQSIKLDLIPLDQEKYFSNFSVYDY